ncbi:hypothetical protein ABBQ32_004475 [Trebouxia sp. C0010 RCD-2024]
MLFKPLICLLIHVLFTRHVAQGATSALDGLVIRNEPGTWFSLKASMPVVFRVSARDYRMWAYGRELNFSSQYANSSFGRSGYFTSLDGLHWNPVPGDGVLGSVLDPRRGTDYFDGGALGFTDVKYANGTFYAWYQAQPDAALTNATDLSKLRAGVAVSHDGIHWSRCNGSAQAQGALLDVTPGIDNLIFGPHIFDFSSASVMSDTAEAKLPPANASLPVPECSQLTPIEGNFTMLYHSLAVTPKLQLQQLTAKSTDLLHFNKTGPLDGISPSKDNSSFDSVGAADGRIVKIPGGYLYFYEATDVNFSYAIGLARSANGVHFVKDTSCTGVPGGPVLTPSTNASAFDASATGTPFPLLQPNGEIWLYYVGFGLQPVLKGAASSEGSFASQIGLAMSVPNAAGKQDYCKFVRAPPVFDAPATYNELGTA